MKLYKNIVDIDETTGMPQDFDSYFIGYRPLVKAAALRVGIPEQDADDAMQVVQLKFWMKNNFGQDFFDPSLDKKFASPLRSWTSLFMLQERDKVIKYGRRYLPQGTTRNDGDDESPSIFEQATVEDFSTDILAEQALAVWVEKASVALADKPHLLPLLQKCVEAADHNTTLTRADVVEATGCKLNKATALLTELREVLTQAGFGTQSLHEMDSDV